MCTVSKNYLLKNNNYKWIKSVNHFVEMDTTISNSIYPTTIYLLPPVRQMVYSETWKSSGEYIWLLIIICFEEWNVLLFHHLTIHQWQKYSLEFSPQRQTIFATISYLEEKPKIYLQNIFIFFCFFLKTNTTSINTKQETKR